MTTTQTTQATVKTNARKSASKATTPTTTAAPSIVKAFVPANRPTAGSLVFAWTWASIQFIKALPKAKQVPVAVQLHGATMLRHHGASGTGKAMYKASDAGMQYDMGFFALGAANKLDPKRAKVDPAIAERMLAYIKTGEVETIAGWTPNAKPYAILEISI